MKERAISARTRRQAALDDLRRQGARVAVVRGPVYLSGRTKLTVKELGDDAAADVTDGEKSARAKRQMNRYFKEPDDKAAAEAVIDHFRNDVPARQAILDALEISSRGPSDQKMLKSVRDAT